MVNADMLAMRREYTALIMIADGLLAIVRASAACNVHTMARIAAEARLAARELASLIVVPPPGIVPSGEIVQMVQ